jgi:hypothetical protein
LLGYERRIENSLYRTMNELRKGQLLREVERSEYRLQAGRESVGAGPRACPDDTGQPGQERGRPRGAAPTAPETPCGVTTNGAQGEERLCQTNPSDAGGDEDRDSCEATVGEVGRGRPTREEPPEGGTRNTRVNAELPTETPCGVTTNGAQDEAQFCQTNPIDVTSDRWQVTSQETPEPSAAELPTSNLTLPTSEETPCGVTTNEETPGGVTTNGETKPMDAPGGKGETVSGQT